ncbi:MAG: FG-GAP-like repeat-containing protein, partial [Bacteroidota bacterium]
DFYVGGAAGFTGQIHVQTITGTFNTININQDIEKEDTAALFFDADNDGDPDLYVVSGGPVFSSSTDIYQDRLYLNTDGVFTKSTRLPNITTCGGSIGASDYDLDGDLDLFIGGRVSPSNYPLLPESILLENQNGHFCNKTPAFLKHIGMISSCVWVNMDADEAEELVLAGEFMPITIIDNQNQQLSLQATIPHSSGWWNCLKEVDFDQDGDIDFLAGNLGHNSNHKASIAEPLCLYANDFDQNGSIDPVLCQYIDGKEYPAASRDKLIQQIPPIKVRFDTYKKYALARMNEVFKKPEKKGMQILQAQQLASCFIENKGQNKFVIKPLPLALQMAPVQDFLTGDFDNDGTIDALAIGNDYATEVGIGRYDAFQGALLQINGGKVNVRTAQQTGFKAEWDARAISEVEVNNKKVIIVGNNSGPLQFFENIQRTEF